MILDEINLDECVLETEDEILADICRTSFYEFVKEFWDTVPSAQPLCDNWHIKVICDEMEKIACRVHAGLPADYHLVINVSPGTSKSTIVSILFHPWVWTWFDRCRFLSSSNAQRLVLDLSSKSRSVIRSEKYQRLFGPIDIVADQDRKDLYRNERGGDRNATTVGGTSPIGFHAHCILLDDLIDPNEVLSELELANARSFVENIHSRMVDKAVSTIILVMQRLGKGDPTDVMLENGRKGGAIPVRHLCFPAELTDDVSPPECMDHYLKNGGLFDEKRLPRSVINGVKGRNAFIYSTQYLQKPQTPGGGRFKEIWFNKRRKSAPYEAKRIWFIDRAATSMGGCGTAGVLMSMDETGFYVEDCVWGQWEPVERDEHLVAAAHRYRLRYGPNHEPLIYIEQEPGSSGVDAYMHTARKLAGYRVFPYLPQGSKDIRMEPWASQLAAGNVWIVENGGWDIASYIKEHVNYRPPMTAGRRVGGLLDRIDASAGAFNLLSQSKSFASTGMRVFSARSLQKKGMVRIITMNFSELATTIVNERAILIVVKDRGEENSLDDSSRAKENNDPTPEAFSGELSRSASSLSLPPHGCNRLLDSCYVEFNDLDPAEITEQWLEPINGNTPDKLVMVPKDGQKIWNTLRRKRTEAYEVVVIVDVGDRRAISLAKGIRDTLGKEFATIYRTSDPESKCEEPAENRHVYATIKTARGMVI